MEENLEEIEKIKRKIFDLEERVAKLEKTAKSVPIKKTGTSAREFI